MENFENHQIFVKKTLCFCKILEMILNLDYVDYPTLKRKTEAVKVII